MTYTAALRHGCAHARDAALARHGLLLEEGDFRAMALAIIAAVSGDVSGAILVSRQAQGREIWIVRVPGGPAVRVVYAPERAQIVTVLSCRHDLPPSPRAAREKLFMAEVRRAK